MEEKVELIIPPEVLEEERQHLLELELRVEEANLEMYNLEMEETVFWLKAPNGQCLELSRWDTLKYKRGTIRKFMRGNRYD